MRKFRQTHSSQAEYAGSIPGIRPTIYAPSACFGITFAPHGHNLSGKRNAPGRNCQYLWIGLFQATSVPVDSVGAES
ncbi:hypothetical protein, partial [Mycobacteroides abscessus]